MTVLSICILESREQIVAGIPISISLSTNLPATIFYSLDGSIPTLFSNIYTGSITLSGGPTIILSAFATDGVLTSPILVETYQTTLLGQNARFPHSGTNACVDSIQSTIDPAPFGSPPIQPNQQFLGPATAGLTVYDELKPAGQGTGFDGAGNETGFTNNQERLLPTRHFPTLRSVKGGKGQDQSSGVGTLPDSVVLQRRNAPERVDINAPSQFFDPSAPMTYIQDLTKPIDPALPVHINTSRFSWENVNSTREGCLYFNSGLDAPPVTGGYVRREFNAAKQTMTFYYFDSTQNKWLISTVPYTPTPNQYNYAGSQVSRKGPPGSQFVYSWIPFKGNWLY